MNHWKRTMGTLCLTGLLCLSLAACGGKTPTASKSAPSSAPDTSEPVAGADWTTWGIINDMGTLVRDAERIDVCVCVHTEDAAIYYDTAEQVLLDEAVYPETIPDAQSAYSGISFDDLNADAQGDIRMTFLHEDGTQTVLVWYWDAEDGYVYQPDCSALHAPGEKT